MMRLAMTARRSFKRNIEAAAVRIQRWARRWCGSAFAAVFVRRWRASVRVQRVFRGHRVRRQHEGSMKMRIAQVESQMMWIRDVELVRLERTMLALQDALDHVLEAVAPLTTAASASLTPASARRCSPERSAGRRGAGEGASSSSSFGQDWQPSPRSPARSLASKFANSTAVM